MNNINNTINHLLCRTRVTRATPPFPLPPFALSPSAPSSRVFLQQLPEFSCPPLSLVSPPGSSTSPATRTPPRPSTRAPSAPSWPTRRAATTSRPSPRSSRGRTCRRGIAAPARPPGAPWSATAPRSKVGCLRPSRLLRRRCCLLRPPRRSRGCTKTLTSSCPTSRRANGATSSLRACAARSSSTAIWCTSHSTGQHAPRLPRSRPGRTRRTHPTRSSRSCRVASSAGGSPTSRPSSTRPCGYAACVAKRVSCPLSTRRARTGRHGSLRCTLSRGCPCCPRGPSPSRPSLRRCPSYTRPRLQRWSSARRRK